MLDKARSAAAFATPEWGVLAALAVHGAMPWWLPASKLEGAVQRLNVLLKNPRLIDEVNEVLQRKAKHTLRARMHYPKAATVKGATWQERLTWATYCGTKVVKSLAKLSLWALGAPWGEVKELLQASRSGGGRASEEVLGTSSEDDGATNPKRSRKNRGRQDRRRPKRFDFGLVIGSVETDFKKAKLPLAPPLRWPD